MSPLQIRLQELRPGDDGSGRRGSSPGSGHRVPESDARLVRNVRPHLRILSRFGRHESQILPEESDAESDSGQAGTTGPVGNLTELRRRRPELVPETARFCSAGSSIAREKRALFDWKSCSHLKVDSQSTVT